MLLYTVRYEIQDVDLTESCGSRMLDTMLITIA